MQLTTLLDSVRAAFLVNPDSTFISALDLPLLFLVSVNLAQTSVPF